jgi:hypothetical protein
LPKQIVFSPQIEYDYNSGSVSSLRGNFRKKIFKNAHLQASYDHNFQHNQFYLNIGFNFDLGFSRAGLFSSTNKLSSTFSQSIAGSMTFDPRQKRIKFNSRPFLGMGSIEFITFLDTNENGKRDESEPQIKGVDVLSPNGGFKEVTADGSTIFKGLEPFVDHYFKLNPTSGGRIDWKLQYQTLNIFVNPNQLKVIEVPIHVVGEVAGYVLESGKGVGGVKINIWDVKQKLITSLISESDGYFAFLGLKSGAYRAQLDSAQLEKRKWEGTKTGYDFNIKNSKEGDYVDYLEFGLQPIGENHALAIERLPLESELPISDKKDNASQAPDLKTEILPDSEKTLVYRVLPYALEKGKEIKTADDIKKGYTETFSLQEADSVQMALRAEGFPEAHIVAFNDRKRISLEEATSIEKNRRLRPGQSIGDTMEEGLVYKVQLHTSVYPVGKDDDIFDDLKNVGAYEHNGTHKYTWGATRNRYEATRLQDMLRKRGFKDAFVVHFYNKRRIGVEDAIAIRQTEPFKGSPFASKNQVIASSNRIGKNGIDKWEGSIENQEVIIDTLPTTKKKTNFREGLSFKVQISASESRLELTNPLFGNLKGIEEYRENGMYKYTWGVSSSFSEANQIKKHLRSQGFKDAFVVPFYDNRKLSPRQVKGTILFRGEQLDGIGGIKVNIYDSINKPKESVLSEADGNFKISGLRPGRYTARLDKGQLSRINMRSLSNSLIFNVHDDIGENIDSLKFVIEASVTEHKKDTEYSASGNTGLIFRVQVLASNPKLSIKNKLLKGLKGVKRYKHRGIYKYTWGEARTLQGVRTLKRQLQKMGFQDAFIVPFYNGARLNMQNAVGRILLNSSGRPHGLEGIRIYIYDSDGGMVTSLVSERDGYFSFLGLTSGIYEAKLDQVQLDHLQLKSDQGPSKFEIDKNKEGDLSDPLEFVLEQKKTAPVPGFGSKNRRTDLVFKIQIAASNVRLPPNMYKYTIEKTTSLSEADRFEEEIRSKGDTDAFVVAFLNNKRISIEEALHILNGEN